MYIFLVGHPGVGKTRTMREGRSLVENLADFHLAPISMTFASLVDSLAAAKRNIVRPPFEPIEYNSMFVCADELGAFVSKYDNEMIDGLSAFYDPDPYQQVRRTSEIKIKIKSPQLNILCGTTPQNLTELMPEKAWGQGFTSRLLMVFSDERIIGDDFAPVEKTFTDDLKHDLELINMMFGEFQVTPAYREAVNNWRQLGEPPTPTHPKLTHYVTRRRAHLYKLSMISSIDRDGSLVLTVDDFNRAMGWMLEAEQTMPEIFKAGATNADGQAMDEILHFIRMTDTGFGVSEQKITRFAMDRIPLHSILRVIDIMEKGGKIFLKGTDRTTKLRYFAAGKEIGTIN